MRLPVGYYSDHIVADPSPWRWHRLREKRNAVSRRKNMLSVARWIITQAHESIATLVDSLNANIWRVLCEIFWNFIWHCYRWTADFYAFMENPKARNYTESERYGKLYKISKSIWIYIKYPIIFARQNNSLSSFYIFNYILKVTNLHKIP